MSGRSGAALLALVLLAASCVRAGGAAEPVAPIPPTSGPSTTTARPSTTSTTATSTTSTTSTTTTSRVPPNTEAPARVTSAPVTTEPAPAPPETAPPETAPPDTAPPTPAPATPRVFAVGDSVMLRAADALRGMSGFEVTVDAEVGRQFRAGIPLVEAAVAGGATIVVIHLGTNGPVGESQFEQMMAAAAGAKVVIITVQLPDEAYPHEAPTNALLVEGAARHGASVADWNGATNGHPELLRPDGYHMDPAAVPLYVSLVAAAL